MKPLQPKNNFLFPKFYSSIIISNDVTSILIHIHKDTEYNNFCQQILYLFPNQNDMKLFYFEGYSKKNII